MTSGFPDGYFERPTVARVQDHLGGGSDNYGPDQDLARAQVTAAPWLPASVRANRAHGPRVLACLVRQYGIDQVIDLGCGLPHEGNRHLPDEVRRMVYVDADPGVEALARMVLAERHGTASLRADLEDMPDLLAAQSALRALRSWLPSGSVLSITHATADRGAEAMSSLTRLYARAGIGFRTRSGQRIRQMLRSWTSLEADGPVTTGSWRDPPRLHPDWDPSHAYAILASPGDRPS